MTSLIVKVWISLVYFDCVFRFRGLERIHEIVRNQKVCLPGHISVVPVNTVCQAVDVACVFYFKQVLCLQRSALTTVLLRRYGWNAEMVIGVRIRPPESHAWVEIERSVVNDKPYMLEIYRELDRC